MIDYDSIKNGYREDEWIFIYVCNLCKFNSQLYMKQCLKCGHGGIRKMKIKLTKWMKNTDGLNELDSVNNDCMEGMD